MPIPADEAISDLLKTLNVGQYALLVTALRQLGGELRIVPSELEELVMDEPPQMEVVSGDGPIVLRLA